MRQTFFTLLILFLSTITHAQTRQVKGEVLSAGKGDPLTGVSVSVKGAASQGTVTDFDGKFTLDIPETNDVTLEVRFVGYESQEVAVGSQATITVRLVSGKKSMDEVVVVGYGEQSRRKVTGAVATLNTENFDERPIARLDQGLVGQIAGVQVKQTTGSVGKPFSINVRGAGSITAGNEPLYVIDGFPMEPQRMNGSGNFDNGSPLDNINPNDIESIQVLKDAAAAAIYGSRASNGVVIINTRKGKAGKARINFNAYGGISRASKKLDMLDGDQWIRRAKNYIDSNWLRQGIPGASTSQTSEERRLLWNANKPAAQQLAPGAINTNWMYDERWLIPGHPGLTFVDWQDEAFRNGTFQNYQLSASGGTEKVRYYMSANYQDVQGFVKGQDFKVFSARANIEADLSKNIKFGINLAPSYSIRNDPNVEGKDNTLHKILSIAPVVDDTSLSNDGYYSTAYRWAGSNTDPMSRLDNRIGENKLFRTLATSFLEVELIKGLKFRTTLNFDNTDNTSRSYVPSNVLASISGSFSTYRRQNLVSENTLNYTTKLGKDHSLSVLAGYAYNNSWIGRSSLSSSGIPYTSYYNQTLPAGSSGSTNESRNVLISYFGRVQYDYKDKYLLTASLRQDGSSRFGPEYRYGVFPSISAGWRVSEERFIKDIRFINDFKVRASYGINGSNNIGDYTWRSTLSINNYSFGSTPTLAAGRAINGISNPNLHWEQSQSQNYGFDLTVLNNRVSLVFDYYTKRNVELLLNQQTHAVTGATSFTNNIGSVQNRGWEVQLNTRNLTGKFQWTTSFNFSQNANKLLSLDGDQTEIEIGSSYTAGGHSILRVGQPLYSIYAVQQNGVLTNEDIENGYPMFGNQNVGDARYVDANGDGKITEADRVIVGQPNPKYFWGITNTFRYKNFDLSIFVQGQNGGHIYSLLGRAINSTNMGNTANTLDVDIATRGNNQTNYTAPFNTDWLYKSDYISIRNITIGYDLGKLFKSNYIQGARIYMSFENWFYWDKYTGGFNPEATNANLSSDSNFSVPGDYGGLPVARSSILGLNFTF